MDRNDKKLISSEIRKLKNRWINRMKIIIILIDRLLNFLHCVGCYGDLEDSTIKSELSNSWAFS